MTRSEAIAKLVASGKYTEAEASAKLDEIKAAKAAKAAEAAKPAEKPRAEVKAPPAPKKAAPVATPKKEASKAPVAVDYTEEAVYAPPSGFAPMGLGGARHRMEDREDEQFLQRNSYFGRPDNAEDLALAIGNRAADDYAKRERVRGSLYNEMTRLGDARRAAIDAQVEARRDPLAEEIAGNTKAKADQALAAEMTRRSIDLAKNGPRPATTPTPSPKPTIYDLSGPTPTQNGKPMVKGGMTAAQKRAKLDAVLELDGNETEAELDGWLANPKIKAALGE